MAASLDPGRMRAASLLLGWQAERQRAAVLDTGAFWSPDIAGWLTSGLAPANAPDLRPPDLLLPWGDAAPAVVDRRRAELAAGLAACRFRDAAWFPALAAGLAAAWDPAWTPGRKDEAPSPGPDGRVGRDEKPDRQDGPPAASGRPAVAPAAGETEAVR